jgi:hypothetical protein
MNRNYYQNDYYCLNKLDKPQILFKYNPPLNVQTTMNEVMMRGQDDYASTFTLRRKRNCCVTEEKCKCENCKCFECKCGKKDNGCGCSRC